MELALHGGAHEIRQEELAVLSKFLKWAGRGRHCAIIQSFIYQALPARVVFGSGTVRQVREEAERLGGRRAIVLSTPGRGERLAGDIAGHLGPLLPFARALLRNNDDVIVTVVGAGARLVEDAGLDVWPIPDPPEEERAALFERARGMSE